MTTIKELRSRREHKLAQAREIHERAGSTIPARKFTDAEQSDYDALMSEVKSIGVEIETELDKPTETEERDEIRTRNTSREWKDASGNPLHVIRSNERLADLPGGRSKETDGFDIGRALKGIALGCWDQDSELEKRVMTVGISADGGYAVESMISNQVIDLARSKSVCIAAGAKTLDMKTHTVDLVKITNDPDVAWYGENSTIALDTAAKIGRHQLRSHKMAVRIALSRELLEDSVGGADMIKNMVINAMAAELDSKLLIGDGDDGEIIGLANADDVQTQESIGAITWDDIIAGQTLIGAANFEPNALIMTPETRGALAILKASTGGSYLIKPPLLDSIKPFTTTGIASTQAFIGDFNEMLIGIRSPLQINSVISQDQLSSDTIQMVIRFRGDCAIMRGAAFSHLSGITY